MENVRTPKVEPYQPPPLAEEDVPLISTAATPDYERRLYVSDNSPMAGGGDIAAAVVAIAMTLGPLTAYAVGLGP